MIEVLSPYKLLRFMSRDIACKFFHIFIMILDYDLKERICIIKKNSYEMNHVTNLHISRVS